MPSEIPPDVTEEQVARRRREPSSAEKNKDSAKKKKKSRKNSRLKFYKQLKRIGKGSYGVVDLVRGKDRRLYVMKVVQNTEGKTTQGGYVCHHLLLPLRLVMVSFSLLFVCALLVCCW